MNPQALIKLEPDLATADKHVNMNNALARAENSLTLAEKRIIAKGLALTDSVPTQALIDADSRGWEVKIMADNYAKTFDLDANTAYEQLKEAGKRA